MVPHYSSSTAFLFLVWYLAEQLILIWCPHVVLKGSIVSCQSKVAYIQLPYKFFLANDLIFLCKSSTIKHRIKYGVSSFIISSRSRKGQVAKLSSTFHGHLSDFISQVCDRCFLPCILVQKTMSLYNDTEELARIVYMRSAHFLGLLIPYALLQLGDR